MIPKRLDSARHPFVQHCVALRDRARVRRECQEVFLEGEVLIQELMGLHAPIALLATSESALKEHLAKATSEALPPALYLLGPAAARRLLSLDPPTVMCAIFPLPKPGHLRAGERWLLCDQVSDPGNLGALIRTAKAFEWDGVFTTVGSCDPYNDKALRASRGASLLLPMALGDIADVQSAQSPTTPLFVASSRRGEDLRAINWPHQRGVWLALGNESHGACPELEALGELIGICAPGMESLNVACAGAILMHEVEMRKEPRE